MVGWDFLITSIPQSKSTDTDSKWKLYICLDPLRSVDIINTKETAEKIQKDMGIMTQEMVESSVPNTLNTFQMNQLFHPESDILKWTAEIGA